MRGDEFYDYLAEKPDPIRRHIIGRQARDGHLIKPLRAFLARDQDEAMAKARVKWPKSRLYYVREEE